MKRQRIPTRLTRTKGIAIVAALLVTSLVLIVVSGLFLLQQNQVNAVEQQRFVVQRHHLLRGALEWAQWVLRKDSRISGIDDLREAWASPLPPTSLSPMFNTEGTITWISDAKLSGDIADAQARINLNALAADGVLDNQQIAVFGRLLAGLGHDPALALVAASRVALLQKRSEGKPSNAVLFMEHPDDLLDTPGFSPVVVETLSDHVSFLPRRGGLNLNTASSTVLSAALACSTSTADAIVQARAVSAFRDLAEFGRRFMHLGLSANPGRFDVSSNFFLVHGGLTMRDGKSALVSLVERSGGLTRIWWVRES